MAVSSDVQICNLALIRLGTNTITSITDGTAAANACLLFYDHCREALLRRHYWNFAMERVSLASSGTPAFGYQNQYQLPADFIRVRSIYNQQNPFVIENNMLLTNDTAPLNMVYVRNITDPTKFDALFVDCLKLELIINIGPRISGDGFDDRTVKAELAALLPDSKIVDSQDGSPPSITANTYFNSRFTGTTQVVGGYYIGDI